MPEQPVPMRDPSVVPPKGLGDLVNDMVRAAAEDAGLVKPTETMTDEEKAEIMDEFTASVVGLHKTLRSVCRRPKKDDKEDSGGLLYQLVNNLNEMNMNGYFFREVITRWANSGKTGIGTLHDIVREVSEEMFSEEGGDGGTE